MMSIKGKAAATPVRSSRLTARQRAHLAERLRDLRGETPQRELARQAGLSPGTIRKIEEGQHDPRLGTMLALRGALDVTSIEELIGPLPSAVLESIQEQDSQAIGNDTD